MNRFNTKEVQLSFLHMYRCDIVLAPPASLGVCIHLLLVASDPQSRWRLHPANGGRMDEHTLKSWFSL